MSLEWLKLLGIAYLRGFFHSNAVVRLFFIWTIVPPVYLYLMFCMTVLEGYSVRDFLFSAGSRVYWMASPAVAALGSALVGISMRLHHAKHINGAA